MFHVLNYTHLFNFHHCLSKMFTHVIKTSSCIPLIVSDNWARSSISSHNKTLNLPYKANPIH